ncbi:MAG: 50S ribosomal protein L17 [Candidatus Pacebacteria bacterium]|nr:50S ribosomal protein L17 [Candidatus Paceibacterota bacterium]
MRKQKQGRKFHRERDQRKALIKSLMREIFLKERIKTTLAKAKEIRRFAERAITKAKKGDLASRRYLLKYLSPALAKKVIYETAPKYKLRNGGYTRIIKIEPRKSDSSKMAIIELVN